MEEIFLETLFDGEKLPKLLKKTDKKYKSQLLLKRLTEKEQIRGLLERLIAKENILR